MSEKECQIEKLLFPIIMDGLQGHRKNYPDGP